MEIRRSHDGAIYLEDEGFKYFLGCSLTKSSTELASIESGADLEETIKKASLRDPFPGRFSLRSSMTPAKDQGWRGTCVAFAINACLEYRHQRLLSEQYTYWKAEIASPDGQDGLNLYDAASTLGKEGYVTGIKVRPGTVDKGIWPYNPFPGSTPDQGPPPATCASAMKYSGASPPPRHLDYKNDYVACWTISSGRPLLLAFDLVGWRWISDEDSYDPIVPPARNEATQWQKALKNSGLSVRSAGHAVVLTGYDRARQVYEFKNSWGSTWRDHGYGEMSFEYVRTYGWDMCDILFGA